jgi:predicted dehydrogenase
MKTQNPSRRKFMQQLSAAGMVLGMEGIASPVFAKSPLTKQKRVGIIGLDTSHSIEFTKLLNNDHADLKYNGYKVTVAYPKGSDAIESNPKKMADNTKAIQDYNVRIATSIEELLQEVDAVMLETNDGRLHVEQAAKIFKTGKPVFNDKPFAASLNDVKKIFSEAEKYNTPVFSSSPLRYIPSVAAAAAGSVGNILGADVFCPAALERSHPDFFWYGIHGVEMLFTVMGKGCETITRVHTTDQDIIVGTWHDGRIGVIRGMRTGKWMYGGMVYGDRDNTSLGSFDGYAALLEKITGFFESGIPPVNAPETIEIYAFMEAADQSKLLGGKPVSLLNLL